MASLHDRFKALQRDYQTHSSFVNFVRAIEGQPLTKRRVAFYFDRWVDKSDYAPNDRRALLEWLYSKTDLGQRKNKGFLGGKAHENSLFCPAWCTIGNATFLNFQYPILYGTLRENMPQV